MDGRERAFDPSAREKFYPAVLCVFIGSGFAALVYEIVWFQLLELVIGSTAASLAVLLGTFMGGMCLGSLAFARVIPASFHPLRVYAALEFGIGLIAILVLYLLPPAADLYATVGGHGSTGILMRALLCAAFLLAPTVLMGATLPCAARFIERTPRGVSWLGILYTANLAGAVAGCLVAGFYLLRLYDMPMATFAAVAINALCAAVALVVAAAAPYRPESGAALIEHRRIRSESAAIYLTIALSGLTALGAQVVWTRLLSLLFGPSVYTFSIILGVFLLGLGLGSSAGSLLARGPRNPLAMLGWCQFLLVGAILWAAFSIDLWLPYWPVDPALNPNPLTAFQLDLARALWAVLPAASLWGASFPLALAAAAPRHEDSARGVGAVYAANTVGAIVGAVAFSIIVIPAIGTQGAQRVLLAVAGAATALVLLARMPAAIKSGTRLRRVAAAAAVVAVALVTAAVAAIVPPVPGTLYAFGRKIMNPDFAAKMLYTGEGMNASIAVSQDENEARYFHVAGKVEASSYPADMRLQRMLGHLPALIDAKPTSVLVVGFGAGVTAGTFVTYPGIERIVICEIEPLIPRKIANYFADENYDVLKDPRVTLVYDDARRFVLTANEKFDIITSDPIHPWVKGAATLYTREYFELVKRHLKPGGIVTQWVPLYESTIDVVKSEMATFFAVFPQGIVWINDRDDGADVVLLGQADPAPIDVDAVVQRLRGNARATASLSDIGFESAIDLLSSYATRAPDLADWLNRASVNTDRDLRLQYLAGLGLNVTNQYRIHEELTAARRLPEGLFVGSEANLAELRNAIENAEPGSYSGNPAPSPGR
ncbi:MAG: fused MFS/spermidine synthase [Hyphomicrobiales bacterium]|nr:fused MFS/spermidine synthase [Hyphomicrobiales bacterium]MBV9428107.1 fused MFS/spermidine synthase [Bradyrhizobiaceae bacterium]